MEVDQEKVRLEKEAEALTEMEMTPEVEARLSDVYERLDALDSDTTEARAASILHGLGFDKHMQVRGWSPGAEPQQ
jgi:ATPase subunit of ABC transporter with duplicated ATPase domains